MNVHNYAINILHKKQNLLNPNMCTFQIKGYIYNNRYT